MSSALDMAIIIVLAVSVFLGWHRGFVKSISGVVRLVCGLVAGALAAFIPPFGIATLVFFVVGFIAASLAVGAALSALDILMKLPLIGLPNRIGGAVLGIIGGVVALIVLLWAGVAFVPQLTAPGALLSPESVASSKIVNLFIAFIGGILPV